MIRIPPPSRLASRALQRALLILLIGVDALLWWLVHPVNVVTVTIGYTWFALLYSVLLLTAISDSGGRIAAVMRLRSLGWLGGISYCVYLLHDTFNFIAHRVFFHAEPRLYTLGQVAVTLLALLATLAVAALSWQFFEKPLIRHGHSHLYEQSTSTTRNLFVPAESYSGWALAMIEHDSTGRAAD